MKSIKNVFCILLLLLSGLCHAGGNIVVVVPAHSEVDKLTRDEVINIFLGRLRQFPNGAAAYPLDLPAGQIEKAHFYRLLVNKDLSEINAYWARLIFSGRTSPPQLARSNEDVIEQLTANPNAISYLERGKVDRRVKIVLDLGVVP